MIDFNEIPDDPGCYLYHNNKKEIIYVGKAKSLNKRVRQYFSTSPKDDKTTLLVKEIDSVKYFVTSNEVEALLLENNLIKKHQPKYNIDLKESQRYAYIAVTNEKFPRIMVARDKKMDAKFFGPFVSGKDREIVIKTLREKFRIRTCNKLPKKECLRYHMNLCSAPCINNISEQDYIKDVKTVERFLKGDTKEVLNELKSKMKEDSKNQKFEGAKIARDQIYAIEYLDEKQKVEKDVRYDQDIINFIVDSGKVYLILFNISRGVLATKKEFSFDFHEGFFEEFITQYYAENDIPKEIILPVELKDESISSYLDNLRKSKVIITVPKIGTKLELLDLVKRNIEIQFIKQDKMLKDLSVKLKLNAVPNIIECFDIAHISGTSTTASMVQFRHGKPDKKNYRHFKIRTVQGVNDFESIAEVVSRRYKRLKEENAEMPDLIVIDGGKWQLSSALESLKSLEIKIPIIALAKQFEEVFVPGLSFPLPISKQSLGLNLLIQIRNEAHRFAQRLHKNIRSKVMLNEE